MKRRGQKVGLQNLTTGDTIRVRVILADSKQGYLGQDSLGEWSWYHPDKWKEINDLSPKGIIARGKKVEPKNKRKATQNSEDDGKHI